MLSPHFVVLGYRDKVFNIGYPVKNKITNIRYAGLTMDYKPLLEKLLTELKLSKKKFAETIGASQGNVSGWFNRSNVKPSIDVLKRISEVHHVNLNWLITGEGSMFNEPEYLELKHNEYLHLPVVAHIAAGLPL